MKQKKKKSNQHAWLLLPFRRCLYDSLLDPAGAGRHASPAAGVCHRTTPQEGQRGGLESHQPLPDWYWYVINILKELATLQFYNILLIQEKKNLC